jgi:DNA invertase Pin-like site-specific DNA recombinase
MAIVSKKELIVLQKRLKTDEAIGNHLHVSRQAIQQLRGKYGIESRYAENPRRDGRIIALYQSGKSIREISKKIGISISLVYRILKNAGISKKYAGKRLSWKRLNGK